MSLRRRKEENIRLLQFHLRSVIDYEYDHRGRKGICNRDSADWILARVRQTCSLQDKPDLTPLEEECRSLLRDEPDLYAAWDVLGLIRMVSGDISGAREALERALNLREDYVPAMANLGHVLIKQGDVVRAERLLKMAHQIQPDHEFALVSLSEAQCMTGQAVEAYRLLEDAVEKNPFELDLWLAYYGASRHTQSVQYFEEDVRKHLPGNSNAMFALARLCYDQMRYVEAEDNLRRLWPHHHPYHVAPLLGKLYVRLDMLERAVEHYQEAIRYDLNGEVLREFAHVLFATGKDTWARAFNIIAECIEYGHEKDALLTDMVLPFRDGRFTVRNTRLVKVMEKQGRGGVCPPSYDVFWMYCVRT